MKKKSPPQAREVQGERFKVMVRQLMQIPESGNDNDLREALRARGESTLAWYEDRIQAIDDYNRGIIDRSDFMPVSACLPGRRSFYKHENWK